MLVDKIYNVEKTINEYEIIQNILNESQRLKSIEEQIKICNEELEDLINIKLAFDSLFIGNTDFLDELNKMVEKIDISFQENPEHANNMISNLITKIRTYNSELKIEWNKYFSLNYSNILGTLELLKKVSDNTEIIRLHSKIKIIGNRWPIFVEDINELKLLNINAEKLIDKLDINEDIQKFLILTLNKQATVRDLDSNILKWLRDTHADENIVLSFKKQDI
mgnify:CR=1 FL=1